jgi:hypothetical protein
MKGNFFHRFNNQNNAYIAISAGNSINQFNNAEPISSTVNTFSTLFFKNNFMKLYNNEFAEVNYGREITNGLFVSGRLGYENRRALFNNTDYTLLKNDAAYLSNDPLQPYNETSTPFQKHHILKGQIGTRVRFGQKYISRPDGKITIQNDDYPVLSVNYEKAFGGSHKNYHYDFISAAIENSLMQKIFRL